MNEALRIRVVTLIEGVAFLLGVGAWFLLRDLGHPVAAVVVGTVVWLLITDLEHFVAQNLGWGNPLFQGYPFHLIRPPK
jgi:hypothetical protein